mgnify:CR=1 FL=1
MQRWRIPIIIGIAVGILISGILLWKTKYSRPVVSPTEALSNSESTLTSQMLVWEDPAGFTFSYPQGVDVNPHPEDTQNYAHIELTSSAHPGHVIVWAKDLPAGQQRLEAWIKENVAYRGATVMDSTFVGEPAKKILLISTPQQRHVVSYADDLLFIIEASLEDAPFWSSVADAIIDSFAFVSLSEDVETVSSAADAPVSDFIAADEEEIIE